MTKKNTKLQEIIMRLLSHIKPIGTSPKKMASNEIRNSNKSLV